MFVLFILLFVIDIILFEFISFFFPVLTSNIELYSLLFILIHGICVLFILIVKGDEYKHIFIIGFILRLFIMFADLYHWFPILHSGGDSESFNWIAVSNQTLTEKMFRTNYTEFLTVLYSFTHCSRYLAQYINVIFGISILLVSRQIFEKLGIRKEIIFKSLIFIALLPNLIILSGILLREAWVQYFAILSVYYFIDWYTSGKELSQLLSIVAVLLASYMHSGIIGLAVGYLIAYLTYNPRNESVQFSRESIIGIAVISISMLFLAGNSSMFASHFEGIDSPDRLNTMINSRVEAGSAYLTWLHSDNIVVSFLVAPLKMFYFMYSPIPLDWRGMGDIIAFTIDSSFYIYLTWYIFKTNIQNRNSQILKKYLLTGLMIVIFLYAYGTIAAGTAMRHRAKIFPILVITFAICENEQKKR